MKWAYDDSLPATFSLAHFLAPTVELELLGEVELR